MSNAERDFDLVLFDLDGTLIDSAPQLALAVNRTLTELGLAEADEAVVPPAPVQFVWKKVPRGWSTRSKVWAPK